MKRQHLGTILRFVMSISLLGLLFVVIDRDALLAAFASIDLSIYLLGVGVFFVAIILWTLRWYLFLRASGESVTFARAFVTLLISLFYSILLPTIVGADVGRMYEMGRNKSRNQASVVSTVLLDRLMGLFSLTVLATVALVFTSQIATSAEIVFAVVGMLFVLVVGWGLFFNRRLVEFLFRFFFAIPLLSRLESFTRETYDTLYVLHWQPRLLLGASVVSLMDNTAASLATVFAAQALGVNISPVYFFLFMPIIWLVTLIPISISGLGLRESAFVFFFTQVGVPAADAVAISLLYYSYSVVVGLLGGVLLLRSTILQARHAQQQTGLAE